MVEEDTLGVGRITRALIAKGSVIVTIVNL